MEEQTPWNSKYNSELTTIKNKHMIKGWIIGYFTGAASLQLLIWLIK